MREIKFRAWAPEDSCMYSDIGDFPIERLNSDKSWTYMQYTGLKDSTGKEIYEGDIVRSVHSGPAPKVVSWTEQASHIGFNLGLGRSGSSGGNHLTILGNIYENKELLNV